MFKLIPLLLPIMLAVLGYKISAGRLSRKLEAQSSLMRDPIILALVKKIAYTLELPKVNVYILEDLNLNGLASPNGKVFITRGFLEKYYSGFVSAEELVGVIAHELGHLALGHTKKRMMTYSTQTALQMGLGLVLSRIVPFVGNYLSAMLLRLVTAKLSRMDEYEADKYAAALMLKMDLGVKPLVDLFNKLETLHSDQNASLTWLQSHPKTKDRITAIEKLEDCWRDRRHIKSET